MRAYIEWFKNPGGVIRLTRDDTLTHGNRTPYFWALPVQLSRPAPDGVISLHGAYTPDGAPAESFDDIMTEEMREAMMRCAYDEGFRRAEWERWKDGRFRKNGWVRIHGLPPK